MADSAGGLGGPPKPEGQTLAGGETEKQKTAPFIAWGVSIYHVLILFGAVFGTLWLEKVCGIGHGEIAKQVYALIFGGLGGTVAALRWVILAVRYNAYDRKRVLWQVFTPLYSAVLAWVGVISLAGGILILSASPNPAEPQFTFFIMGFSFLAGFASESFSHRLIVAARTLFGEPSEKAELGLTSSLEQKK
jgi:hypothetical protein